MSFVPNRSFHPHGVQMGPLPPPPPVAPALTMPPPPPPPLHTDNNAAAGRRNTVSGVEPMRIDTARSMPVLFLGNANFGNLMTCSPVSMSGVEAEHLPSPTKDRVDLQDRIEYVAATIDAVHQAVIESTERTLDLHPIDRAIINETQLRGRDMEARVAELVVNTQSISTQVDAIGLQQDATARAIGNVNALVNRLGVGLLGEHGNAETGVLRVLNQLVAVLSAFKDQFERTSLEMDQAVQQVDERTQRVEQLLSSRFGPRAFEAPRAPTVARTVAAVQVPQSSGGGIQGGRNGTPVPQYSIL
ncbi:hypothetical protein AURDEDRAFT_177680 [Auricularia subglabra TFB-10046 SS5]|uniref:Uncharacterized protein n=1 Tax=Auricularia subglabra (strain TFB-10046 / SS5) TaxID=717982 RepID=J0WLN9_AURST|nr:hypothetical protein AURDEDRAFT_177680 [Auricularia subglabra TFB-10046 SS5]